MDYLNQISTHFNLDGRVILRESGNLVSVESVDPVYQKDMLDMLKQTQRTENVVGWYHSHPSFGCWLSSVDINTQVINK